MLKTEKKQGLEINMINIVNKEIRIKFSLSIPSTKILMDHEIQKIKDSYNFDIKQSFSNLNKLNLEFLSRLLKQNCNAEIVGN